MTVEERQLRAWVRSVFRHAASRWIQRQGPPHPPTLVPIDNEEEMSWTGINQEGHAPDADARLWMIHCLPQLTARE